MHTVHFNILWRRASSAVELPHLTGADRRRVISRRTSDANRVLDLGLRLVSLCIWRVPGINETALMLSRSWLSTEPCCCPRHRMVRNGLSDQITANEQTREGSSPQESDDAQSCQNINTPTVIEQVSLRRCWSSPIPGPKDAAERMLEWLTDHPAAAWSTQHFPLIVGNQAGLLMRIHGDPRFSTFESTGRRSEHPQPRTRWTASSSRPCQVSCPLLRTRWRWIRARACRQSEGRRATAVVGELIAHRPWTAAPLSSWSCEARIKTLAISSGRVCGTCGSNLSAWRPCGRR